MDRFPLPNVNLRYDLDTQGNRVSSFMGLASCTSKVCIQVEAEFSPSSSTPKPLYMVLVVWDLKCNLCDDKKVI